MEYLKTFLSKLNSNNVLFLSLRIGGTVELYLITQELPYVSSIFSLLIVPPS